jgi:hypothetical protein
MRTIYARPLNEATRKKFREDADAYFHHTFNPDWYYSCTDNAIWVDSGYGFEFSEDFQREKLSFVLERLTEGVDYELEIE